MGKVKLKIIANSLRELQSELEEKDLLVIMRKTKILKSGSCQLMEDP